MKRVIQEHLAMIQLQAGNNSVLEWLMSIVFKNLKNNFPEIWIRNSCFFKAHHPLVSDIDISYLGDVKTAKRIYLKIVKNKLLGELNFYPKEIFTDLVSLINPYELDRDPVLRDLTLPKLKSSAQKEVFLLRHIIGDQFWLLRNPMIRQKKWNYILNIVNVKTSAISLENLVNLISNKKALEFYLSAHGKNLFNHFKDSPYRSFFPHKYIWEEEDLNFLTQLSTDDKEVLIEQIKWEFWGIGTQLHWINLEVSIEFLTRLKNIVIHIGLDDSSVQNMERILSFMTQELRANH